MTATPSSRKMADIDNIDAAGGIVAETKKTVINTAKEGDAVSISATESCSSVSSSSNNSTGGGTYSDTEVEADDNSNSNNSRNNDDDNETENVIIGDHTPFSASTSSLLTATTETESISTSLRRRRGGGKDEKNVIVNANANDNKLSKTATTNGAYPPSYTPMRWLEFAIGSLIFFSSLPLVVAQIVSCTVWELIDQSTFKITDMGTKLNIRMDSFLKKFVHHPKDGFIVNTTLWLGVVLPSYFFWEAYSQYNSIQEGNGFIWYRAAIYNVVRIGPMYRHFMYVYVLCHKEAHSYGKLFSEPHNTYLGLKYVYNYFIGFFHGVLPGPFTESHIYNHHKYDNSVDDVYSTGAYPRDSFVEFLRYVYVWFLYALNVSSVMKFYEERKYDRVWRSIAGTVYYVIGVTVAWKCVSSQFALFYVLYPLIEGNILLSAVNYTWHAFIDPNDHDNDYVNSVTILDGLNFTLDEEYHVVHHQYGGVHWSKNKELYLKHIDEYKKCTATIFKECNLFVIWGMIVAKDYEGLTDHYVQLDEDESKHLSKKELAQLLKERLRCTTWSY